MSYLRNLLLVICLGALAGTTWVACGGAAPPAKAPAAGEEGTPESPEEPMSESVDDEAVGGDKDEDADSGTDTLLGRDPCDAPVPE